MLSPEESKKAIIKTFRKEYIANIEKLFNVLDTNSRMSVFRRLKSIGYLTSYTDAGRYYTLKDIPVFDSFGLWFYKDIGFSKAGTLKATVIENVNSSNAGMTPKELLHLLKIRVPNTLHNALHGLVKSAVLSRYRSKGLCLYTNIDPDKAQKQIETRRREIQKRTKPVEPLSTEATIAILVEALKCMKALVPPATIVDRLAVRGLIVTAEQVNQVFTDYEIQVEKKTMKCL